MTDWTSFRAALEAAITAAMPSAVASPANNDGPTVSWTNDRRPYGKHRILLQEISTTVEQDRDSALGDGGAQYLSSLMAVTVQVTCESQHDDPALNALWLIEQVRLGLRRVSVREALTTAGVAISEFPGAIIQRAYAADGRMISAFSFDMICRTAFTFTSTDSAGLIEEVIGEGEGGLEGADVDIVDPDPEP